MSIKILLAAAIAAVMLLPIGAQAQSPPGPHPVSAGNPAPRIKVASPKSRTYKVGQDTDVPILMHRGQSLSDYDVQEHVAAPRSQVAQRKNGTKIRFTRAGNYSLKVSTRDNKHHSQYQTFAFRIK